MWLTPPLLTLTGPPYLPLRLLILGLGVLCIEDSEMSQRQ